MHLERMDEDRARAGRLDRSEGGRRRLEAAVASTALEVVFKQGETVHRLHSRVGT